MALVRFHDLPSGERSPRIGRLPAADNAYRLKPGKPLLIGRSQQMADLRVKDDDELMRNLRHTLHRFGASSGSARDAVSRMLATFGSADDGWSRAHALLYYDTERDPPTLMACSFARAPERIAVQPYLRHATPLPPGVHRELPSLCTVWLVPSRAAQPEARLSIVEPTSYACEFPRAVASVALTDPAAGSQAEYPWSHPEEPQVRPLAPKAALSLLLMAARLLRFPAVERRPKLTDMTGTDSRNSRVRDNMRQTFLKDLHRVRGEKGHDFDGSLHETDVGDAFDRGLIDIAALGQVLLDELDDEVWKSVGSTDTQWREAVKARDELRQLAQDLDLTGLST